MPTDRSPSAVPQTAAKDHCAIVESCAALAPVTMAVAHPCDRESLQGAVEAALAGLIEPILVGPERKIRSVAKAEGIDLATYRIVTVPHSHAAARTAVALVRAGEAQAIMKGSLHTDELMGAVVDRESGLRTQRRVSHVFLMEVPAYHKTLMITDAAINIDPTLDDKRDIVQNAIDLAHALGTVVPKVAILAAVETVTTKLRSTVEAGALCKMADRGQITGAILDGPLAYDNAISEDAAKAKGLVSPVAGDPDILLVPDLESGNMLAKQLMYLAHAGAAGVVLGARVPIVLTSRSDKADTRKASSAIAVRMIHSRNQNYPGPSARDNIKST